MATSKRKKPKRKSGAKAKSKSKKRSPAKHSKKPPRRTANAPAGGGDDYDRFREQQAGISRARSAKGREIGPPPDIADVDRRASCRTSLKLFCETYNSEAFTLDWSEEHLRVIARIEEAVTLGALYALAMPRGSGKSTICRMASLWILSYAICRYLFVIGANADKAEDTLATLKTFIRFLPTYAADFPEISHAAIALGGIANRASGQTCQGQSTLIEWAGDRLVLPTMPPPANWTEDCSTRPLRADGMVPTSGLVVSTSGLTGDGIRGSLLTLSTGELLRPDFVLLDDPQTNESAHSKTQNASREQLVAADVLGMAGPDRAIAAVMPCTVIAKGDFVDRILDRTKHPLWRGERMRLLRSMPKNMRAWEDYFEVYKACAQLEPPDFTESNRYYVEHRQVLDEGAVASWPERKLDWEVSAVQHAMHLYCRDQAAFWSEYQNDPIDELSAAVSKKLEADQIKRRFNNIPRLVVPRESTRLVAFVDCGKDLLWYAVAGLDERFSGGLVDYGWWPDQSKRYFAKANPPVTLGDKYPNHDKDQLLYAALRDLIATVLGRDYARHQTEDRVRVDRCLIDEGWNDKVVYQFCRESPFASILMPSKGHVPKSLSHTPMARWAARPGERAAKAGQPSWRVGPVGSGKGRHTVFESNEFKSFTAERLTTKPGGGGCLQIFGDDSIDHSMFADHCTAEFATEITVDGRRHERWQMKATRDDNDLFDCAVGCMVAAAIQGLEWSADKEKPADPPRPTDPPLSWKEQQKRAFEEFQRKKREQAARNRPPGPPGTTGR